jgi:predicted DNA-binding transcriptional regulator AlpA
VPAEPAPDDKNMLTIQDVVRMTTLSPSSVNRMYREQPPRLPPPVKIGQRRKAWRARDIAAWVEARDEQTNTPRNRQRH